GGTDKTERDIYTVINAAALDDKENYTAKIFEKYTWYGSSDYPVKADTQDAYNTLINRINDGSVNKSVTMTVGKDVATSGEGIPTVEEGKTAPQVYEEKYTVTFKNEDGTELQSGLVAYGTLPSYTGATPTKAATAQYTYTFSGWNSEVVAVTGEAIYTATYSETVNQYVVSFDAGTNAQTAVNSKTYYSAGNQTVDYNGHATAPASDPYKNAFTFDGWTLNGTDVVDISQVAITGNTTFTAKYTENVTDYDYRYTTGINGWYDQSLKISFGSSYASKVILASAFIRGSIEGSILTSNYPVGYYYNNSSNINAAYSCPIRTDYLGVNRDWNKQTLSFITDENGDCYIGPSRMHNNANGYGQFSFYIKELTVLASDDISAGTDAVVANYYQNGRQITVNVGSEYANKTAVFKMSIFGAIANVPSGDNIRVFAYSGAADSYTGASVNTQLRAGSWQDILFTATPDASGNIRLTGFVPSGFGYSFGYLFKNLEYAGDYASKTDGWGYRAYGVFDSYADLTVPSKYIGQSVTVSMKVKTDVETAGAGTCGFQITKYFTGSYQNSYYLQAVKLFRPLTNITEWTQIYFVIDSVPSDGKVRLLASVLDNDGSSVWTLFMKDVEFVDDTVYITTSDGWGYRAYDVFGKYADIEVPSQYLDYDNITVTLKYRVSIFNKENNPATKCGLQLVKYAPGKSTDHIMFITLLNQGQLNNTDWQSTSFTIAKSNLVSGKFRIEGSVTGNDGTTPNFMVMMKDMTFSAA
ncbi:MAG: InlB B-repeat-containing protein, partial [Clostridia bacterium]|nr:InlB B-repeat-containing protein [Clostridia bacterium]